MVETGYDPFAQNPLPLSEEQMNIETCFGDGKAFPMGPECTFQGKTLPTLCQWSEGGGISGTIMTNVLWRLDASGVIDKSGGVNPFLLADTHASWLSLEFLRYINDPAHT
jgi:hypothetical protein